MLTGEEVMEIRVLHRQGMSIRGIARTTGLSRNVVRRYLRSPEAPRDKRRAPRPSKLDPFKSYVSERLRAAAPSRIPATALLVELKARGYQGGITILKEFMAGFLPEKCDDPVIRFETEPRPADASRLGGHWAGTRSDFGVRGDAGMEPVELRRVLRGREGRNADPGPRTCLRSIWRHPARSAVRQREDSRG